MVNFSADLAQSLTEFLDLSQNDYVQYGPGRLCLMVFKAIFNSTYVFQLYIGGGNRRAIENNRPVASH